MMSRIIKLIGSIVFHVVHLIWELIAKAIGLAAQPPLIILYYHNIRKEQRARFAWQMDALIRCGMPVLAGTDHATSVAKRLVAVTFDDGFVSAVQNALPVLLERKIPVTIFVSTACIGQPCSWIVNEGDPDHKELILSSEEIRNLSEQGVVIGSHSVSHRPLTTLSEREAWQELVESKDKLELITGLPVDMFSFPHGDYISEIVNLAIQAGYRHGFTIVPRFATTKAEESLRGRIKASPTDWRIEFWLKLRGGYCWLWAGQNLKRQVQHLLAKLPGLWSHGQRNSCDRYDNIILQ